MNRTLRLLPLLVALALGACGGESETTSSTPTPPPEATTAPTPPPSENAGPAGPRAEDESFVLEARPDAAGYSANTLGRFAIVIEGKDGWHLNHEFPVSVELSGGDGMQFPKATLGKEDAAEFVDERARFDVPFTPTAAGEVRAVVSFAMCNPTSCVPKSHTVALALNVQ